MHPGWNVLLADTSPDADAYGAAHFGAPGPEAAALLGQGAHCPLPGMGIIQVRGEDASAFLQGQLTQDVADLPPGRVRLAGYCNAKGRLHAVFHVLGTDDGFLLLTEAGLVDALIRRLRMYVLRSKVSLDDVSVQYQAIGVTGTRVALLTELAGSLPEDAGSVHQAGDLILIRWPGDAVLLLTPADDGGAIWERLQAAGDPSGPQAWRLLAIRQGLPAVYPETAETFVPQQVNLERISGVHFRKGCYPGQEVVARMHYLGKPSRRMYRLAGPGEMPPAPGERVQAADGGSAGQVVQAAVGEDGIEMLAVLRTSHAGRQDLAVGDTPLDFRDLPYALED